MKRIYLDYAATTPVDPQVFKAMEPYLKNIFGNPSSLHEFGQEARRAVQVARQQVANLINADQEEIIFTSGGTEANNTALKGIFFAKEKLDGHLIVSCIEHHAVLEPAKFLKNRNIQVDYLPVDSNGIVNLNKLKDLLRPETVLVSVMHANNEMGAIQPIEEIVEIIKEYRKKNNSLYPYFHTDAVQTASHLPIDVKKIDIDLLSMSAHKLYGPKGIGALYIKQGIKIAPFIEGGEQEDKRRASTENTPGIIGFGKAAEMAREEMVQENKRLIELRDWLIQSILNKIPKTKLNGHPAQRLSNNVNVSIAGVEGEALLIALDHEGIACSTGSACSSESLVPSHVLLKMGLPVEIAHSSLRFTLGRWTKKKDLEYLVKKLELIVKRLRNVSALKAEEIEI